MYFSSYTESKMYTKNTRLLLNRCNVSFLDYLNRYTREARPTVTSTIFVRVLYPSVTLILFWNKKKLDWALQLVPNVSKWEFLRNCSNLPLFPLLGRTGIVRLVYKEPISILLWQIEWQCSYADPFRRAWMHMGSSWTCFQVSIFIEKFVAL